MLFGQPNRLAEESSREWVKALGYLGARAKFRMLKLGSIITLPLDLPTLKVEGSKLICHVIIFSSNHTAVPSTPQPIGSRSLTEACLSASLVYFKFAFATRHLLQGGDPLYWIATEYRFEPASI